MSVVLTWSSLTFVNILFLYVWLQITCNVNFLSDADTREHHAIFWWPACYFYLIRVICHINKLSMALCQHAILILPVSVHVRAKRTSKCSQCLKGLNGHFIIAKWAEKTWSKLNLRGKTAWFLKNFPGRWGRGRCGSHQL
jgi:hypothetical protein